ncbi:MAG: LacI family DNA-binding transcriptional regulator [Clostridia bacterium]|nr:LacI family DNA-binding transcriptional regulator [Clostridia bacterium]
MATMRDVALLAGVSTATVSHVVNGSKKLSPETTERVLQAISQINYTPNTVAKSLRLGQTHTIGVLVEDIRGLPVAAIVSGISETLAKSGYKTIFHDLHLLEKLYNQYEQIGTYRQRINDGVALLQAANVDGIIYVAMHDRHLDYLLDPMETPLVYAYSHGTENDTFVTYSNKDSAADMIRYLLSKGHQRIAVIAGHPHSYPTAQRLLGIQMAMQQAGLPLPAEYIRYGDWEYESGKIETEAILQLDPLPTAIFAMNDLMAAGCMSVLQAHGLRIPQDMAVAGFDNREIASYLQPPLTTIELPTPEIGAKAAIHIISMISNPRPHPWREIIRCSIIERASI